MWGLPTPRADPLRVPVNLALLRCVLPVLWGFPCSPASWFQGCRRSPAGIFLAWPGAPTTKTRRTRCRPPVLAEAALAELPVAGVVGETGAILLPPLPRPLPRPHPLVALLATAVTATTAARDATLRATPGG